jgi:hypothetical protein
LRAEKEAAWREAAEKSRVKAKAIAEAEAIEEAALRQAEQARAAFERAIAKRKEVCYIIIYLTKER